VEADVCIWRYALLVVHARKEEECLTDLVCLFVQKSLRKMFFILRNIHYATIHTTQTNEDILRLCPIKIALI